ncbi:phosphoribosyltransferase [Chitinophaga japonensis]|uniref:Putative phosphoribosyltransferase n=1 Tax=Chitinophaga japonensis TaxID=104662 RepID=A0A562STI8_CHIJA|nr:phosphoribosyltransferase family protein [Chitinophaga japonensis]TWI84106.1 putative phosphoribosyltransferase [Chitinophaga japonensis]
MFHNRITAGYELASRLKKFRDGDGVVMAIPRGGVPVGYVVAKELNLPLSLALVKKIGHPGNKEYAIGAASLADSYVIPHEGVSSGYIDATVARVRERLQEMQHTYQDHSRQEPLSGRTVIIVDDGIATGNTLLATVEMLRRERPSKIVVAVPVASREAFLQLSDAADEIVCLRVPEVFWGVGAFYEDFHQVTDHQVIFYLRKLREQHNERV